MFFFAAMMASAVTMVATDAARFEATPTLASSRGIFSVAMAVLMVVVARATARLGTDAGTSDDGTPRPPRRSNLGLWIDVGLHAWVLNGGQFAAWAYTVSGENVLLATPIAWLPWAIASLVRADAEGAQKAHYAGLRFEGAARRAAWSLGSRVRLLLLLPIMIAVGVEWAASYFPAAEAVVYSLGAAGPVMLTVINLLSVVSLSPFLVGWFLRVRPLKDAELQQALEADLKVQGIGKCPVGELDTRGQIPNAAYLGLGGFSRRIVITDALLSVLGKEEVRAVVAHETAHGTRHHIPTIVAYIVAMLGIGAAFGSDLLTFSQYVAIALPLGSKELEVAVAQNVMYAFAFGWGILGIWWFGRMSRAFETEADITAARALGSGEGLAKALLALHHAFGGRIDRTGFRHPSILTRCRYLTEIATEPKLGDVLIGPARKHRIVVACGLLLALLGGARHLGEVKDIGPLRVDVLMGSRLDDVSRLTRAADRARTLLIHDRYRVEANSLGIAALVALIDLDLKVGRFDDAEAKLLELNEAWPTGDAVGDYNRAHLHALLAVARVGGDAAFVAVRLAEEARVQLDEKLRERGLALDATNARETEREISIARSLSQPDATWPDDPPAGAPAWQREAIAMTRARLANKETPR